MLGLPLPWTKCLARFWALVCSMSKIRWLCWPHRLALVGLFCAVPSFSGSEMIWLDPLVGLSWCCCSLWNEWDLHVYAFCRNEWFSHVRRASSLADGFTLLGSTLLHCGAVLKGTLSGLLFHLLLCSFCCLTALFPEGTALLRIKICFLSKIYFLLSLRAISERLGKALVCDFR